MSQYNVSGMTRSAKQDKVSKWNQMIDLDDKRRSGGLKSNMLSDYTRIFDKAPLAYNQIVNLVPGPLAVV